MTKSYGIDCQLTYTYEWWKNHLEPDLMYDRPNENRQKVSEQIDVTPEALVAHPPLTITDQGPVEFVKTKPSGTTPAQTQELAMIEVCPVCDTTLKLYKTTDFGRTIFRCANCYVKLKRSQMGWIVDDS
jgi:hypothetical protein